MPKSTDFKRLLNRLSPAWRTLWISAALSLLLEIVNLPVSIPRMPPEMKQAMALGLVGLVVLRALVVYGLWYRARWAVAVGTFLALLTVPTPFITVQTANFTLPPSPQDWPQAVVNAAFLVGLALAFRERRG